MGRDGAGGTGGFLQCRKYDFIGVRKAGLLAGQSPYSHALFDTCATVLDDAVLQGPRLLVRELEVEVGVVHRVLQYLAEDPVEAAVVQPARSQDELTRNTQRINLGGDIGHR